MNAPASTIVVDPLPCGLIMPLAEFDGCSAQHWDDVRTIITSAIEGIDAPKFRPRMVSDGDETGIIHRRIVHNVYADPIAVCDVSGRNPNVLFELGMRLAFDRPVVIVKDNPTPFMFDTGMIEHLSYPRDLRHGAIEDFKEKLQKKVISTFKASIEDPDSVSFIKSFGPIKVVKLDEVKEPTEKAILTMLNELADKVDRLSASQRSEPISATTRLSSMFETATGSQNGLSRALARNIQPTDSISDEELRRLRTGLKERVRDKHSPDKIKRWAASTFPELVDQIGPTNFSILVARLIAEL